MILESCQTFQRFLDEYYDSREYPLRAEKAEAEENFGKVEKT